MDFRSGPAIVADDIPDSPLAKLFEDSDKLAELNASKVADNPVAPMA